jgi:succinate dehydrogenase / fumarate reductase cytochrome b subunit
MSAVQVDSMSVHQPQAVYKTSIGKKIIMAISGIVFVGFISGHMLGNLQVFLGQDTLNTYAEALQGLGALLWFIRAFLLAFIAFHIIFGIKLYFENRSSRPVRYVRVQNVESNLASRTMIFTGLLILFFVAYHLLHFTLIVTNPEYAALKDSLGRHDVYSMMILGFQNYIISGVYILAILFLSFHLSHSLFSLFQTLGLTNGVWVPRLRMISNIFAILIFIGYVSIPVGILLNLAKLPEGGLL